MTPLKIRDVKRIPITSMSVLVYAGNEENENKQI